MAGHIQLIVGLGNPGPEYEDTRHNAGAWFVQQLAEKNSATFKTQTKFKGNSTKISVQGHDCQLLIPTTFMNHSGQSVKAMLQFFKLKPSQMLVVHDELDLDPGTARLKYDGGHGGHNGLRDLISQLGTREFYRLRLGIGHPGNRSQVTNYVLKKPSTDELAGILASITRSMKSIPLLLNGEEQKAMKLLNTESKSEQDKI